MNAATCDRPTTGAVIRGPRAPSLRRNFSWTLAGNLIYGACQWGMLVVLAKLGSVEMVGQFALALAITAPVLMFSNLQLRGVQATDARGDYAFGDYLGLRLVMTAAALAVIAGLALLLGTTPVTAAVIALVGALKAVEAVSDVFYGFLQKHERMDRIALSLVLKGILSLAAFGVTIYLTRNLVWGSVALVVSSLLILVAYDLRSAVAVSREEPAPCSAPANQEVSPFGKVADGSPSGVLHGSPPFGRLVPHWHLLSLLRLARLALPLGLVMFITSFTINIPRYYVEHYQGLRELGVFAAICYLMEASGRIMSALAESASPRLARHYAAGDRQQFRALLIRLVGVGATLGGLAVLAALLAGRELLALVYRAEYADRVDVFVWVAVGGLLGYVNSALGYAMTAARFFVVQAPLFLVSGLCTAVACAWLVPAYALVGAAWAVALGLVVQLVCSTVVVSYALTIRRGEVPR